MIFAVLAGRGLATAVKSIDGSTRRGQAPALQELLLVILSAELTAGGIDIAA